MDDRIANHPPGRAEREARRMYQKMVSMWAMDCLACRSMMRPVATGLARGGRREAGWGRGLNFENDRD